MIKSTKVSIKFSNTTKKDKIQTFLNEYRSVVSQFIDIFWLKEKIKSLATKEECQQITTWLSARMIQCAGKQASGIVRGTRKKQEKRKFIIDKLNKNGEFKKARKLQKIYDEISISKPNIKEIEVELDERFIELDLNNSTSFDGWIILSSIGNKLKIQLPFKKTKHFNKLELIGKIKKGIRISNKNITFMFEIHGVKVKQDGKVLGIDIGLKDTLSCSNGQQISKDKHGYDYQKICNKLALKKKGSKAFERTVKQRTNYLHWCVNQLNLNGISVLQRENIKDLRKYKRQRRNMQAWNYAELFQILDMKAIDSGVQIKKLSPTYTSQRCSQCGWTRKSNRKGKIFKCDKCGYTHDSDLNASLNISFNLREISTKERLKQKNRLGFYWEVLS